jgi:hypothetical protein
MMLTRGISIAVSPSVFYSNDTPAGPKKQAPAAGPKGGFGMIFHIAVYAMTCYNIKAKIRQ